MRFSSIVSAAAVLAGTATAEIKPLPVPTSCTGVSAFKYKMTAAAGWTAVKILGGLTQPRTVIWDTEGNLIVLQNRKGASVHTFGADGCVSSTAMLISGGGLNHGLALSPDGKTLYASSETTVYSWAYDAATRKVSGQKTLVKGMSTGIHSSRTVTVSTKDPRFLLVQVGSNSNLDMATLDKKTGRSIIKVFDTTKAPASGYNYNTEGEVFAYGLRNEIGWAEDPNGIAWGVENSGDDFARTENGQRKDIHTDNPAEKLNRLGDPLKTRDAWFGYPTCFTVWEPSSFAANSGLKTGSHFVLSPNSTFNDASCNKDAIPPRLSFQAHSAPIWNTFDKDAKNMYVTFHGSWNRSPATGFKVVQIPFTRLADGSYDPVAPADSKTGYKDIWTTPNPGSCTANGLTNSNCIRLTASSWDPAGRGLFVASDNSNEGEVVLLVPPKA